MTEITADFASFTADAPTLLDLTGAVGLSSEGWSAVTEEARFDLATGRIESSGTMTLELESDGHRHKKLNPDH